MTKKKSEKLSIQSQQPPVQLPALLVAIPPSAEKDRRLEKSKASQVSEKELLD